MGARGYLLWGAEMSMRMKIDEDVAVFLAALVAGFVVAWLVLL